MCTKAILLALVICSLRLFLFAVQVYAAPSPHDGFTHSLELDPGVYSVYWKYDQDTVTFEVHAQTLGYVGFGVSPNGGMAGSDIVIGWVQGDQAWFAVSLHGTINLIYHNILVQHFLSDHCLILHTLVLYSKLKM